MFLEVLCKAMQQEELLLVAGGFCRFHKKKDGHVVIDELVVLPEQRMKGIGRKLIKGLQKQHKTLEMKCPAEMEGVSVFLEKMGFVEHAMKVGKKRSWKIWMWRK